MLAYFTRKHGPLVHCVQVFLQTIVFGTLVISFLTTVCCGLMGLLIVFVQVNFLAASELTSFTGERCCLFMFLYNVLFKSLVTQCLILAYFPHKHGIVHCFHVFLQKIFFGTLVIALETTVCGIASDVRPDQLSDRF